MTLQIHFHFLSYTPLFVKLHRPMFRPFSLILIIFEIIPGNILISTANKKAITKAPIISSSLDMSKTTIEGKPYKENEDLATLNQTTSKSINTILNKECNLNG